MVEDIGRGNISAVSVSELDSGPKGRKFLMLLYKKNKFHGLGFWDVNYSYFIPLYCFEAPDFEKFVKE